MVFRVSYYVVTKAGTDKTLWLDMLRKSGAAVDQWDDPIYSDVMPRKPRGGQVGIEQLPDLTEAIRSLGSGERLTIPHAGHLIGAPVWEVVAAALVRAAAEMELLVEKTVLDGTDLEAGAALIRRQRGRALTDARAKAGLPTGRPRVKLTGKSLAEALRLFPDPAWSTSRIATHLGLDRMTMLRRIEEATGTMSKARAAQEASADNWPPKRRLTQER
ncbi:hypothetical protein [Azospirillum sp. B4]|uniref:hypothetical protein n=1 Tax=Azospirillum sp. B4 TaxID=95605 RepID=UPI0005CB7B95|nr:hypothetical protein [Azospirillum sp. B4]